MPRHGAIVLAAGASRRLGRPKQLLQIDGETLLHRAARLAAATAPLELVVVLGHEAELLRVALHGLPLRCIVAADWRQGMGATLAAGVAALPAGCDGVLVVLCDQPALDLLHLQALVARWQQAPRRAVASGYAGTVGVPALLPRHWLQPGQLHGDTGARQLLRARQDQVDAIANERLQFDIDAPGDLGDGGADLSSP